LKTIPNYFIGVLPSGIPVYCNVAETVKKGFLVPFYTAKRRVKNHDSIVMNPNEFFNLLGLGNFIKEQYKIPAHILVGFRDSKLSLFEAGGSRAVTSRPLLAISCISYNCKETVIIIDDGIQTCPVCNRSFMVE
jgi:hypothetical protein